MSSAGTPVASVYKTSGRIAITDSVAIVISSADVQMTLDNGTADLHAIVVKCLGPGMLSLSGTIDGQHQAIALHSRGMIKDSLQLQWIASLASYIVT